MGGQSLTQDQKPKPPPKIESAEMFPSLTSSDGWEVVPRHFGEAEQPSTVPSWGQRAAANASIPTPKAASHRIGAWANPVHKKDKQAETTDFDPSLDDFELRKHGGRRREARSKKSIGKEVVVEAQEFHDSD